MADTAAFFAKKKNKKKKVFKLNANNIDVATVSSTVHVDAPALSTDHDPSSAGLPAVSSLSVTDAPENGKASGDEWDDEALAAATSSKRGPVASTPATTELLDMKALDPKRSESDNIAEKLRLEETKAQLAAAREGMEREAQRIKEEEQKKLDAASSGAATPGSEGGKWVPRHMRGSGMGGGLGGGGLPKIRLGGAAASAQRLDTKDENLFPDLATADKLLEEQQKSQQAAFKPPKKTPVGGRATWGSRPPLNLKKKEETKKEETKEEPKPEPEPPAPAPEPTPEAEKPAAPAPVEAPPAAAAPAPPPAGAVKPVAKKKKKKKDLSTFKPGG